MQPLLILVPFIAIIVLNLLPQKFARRLAFWLALAISICQIIAVFFLRSSSVAAYLGPLSLMFKFNLMNDTFSALMLFSIGLVLFSALLVARQVLKDKGALFNFINLSLILLAGMNGTVMSRDIFSLYVFIEITSITSFIMIVFNKDIQAFEGAFKYIMLSVLATAFMLGAIALLVILAGSTDFLTVKAALIQNSHSSLLKFTVVMFLCGFFIKAGLVPFHGWLPDAYTVAPSPVSILLAGIVTKTVGVYTLMRVVAVVFGFNNAITSALLFIGSFSVVLAAIAALSQNDFKRMLAYSSISQVGYIILGFGVGTPLGIAGAAFHLFNHSVFKSLLFVNSAAVESQTGTRQMEKLSGLAQRMPVTGMTSVVASLSAAGIPPLAGFWSKLMIIISLWMAGHYGFCIVAVFSSVLTLAYFLSLQRAVFFGKLTHSLENIKEGGLAFTIPAFLLAGIILGCGIFYPWLLKSIFLPLGEALRG